MESNNKEDKLSDEDNLSEEDNSSEKSLSKKEAETQRKVHDHDRSPSSAAASSYFFRGETKIKLRKVELASKNDVSNRVEGQDEIYRCCGREFSSRQAYGGHVRHHEVDNLSEKSLSKKEAETQRKVDDHDYDRSSSAAASSSYFLRRNTKTKLEKVELASKNNVSNRVEVPDKIYPCCCGKIFSSPHAYAGHKGQCKKPNSKGDNASSSYGHMREHPERVRKGIRSPHSDETATQPDTQLQRDEPAKDSRSCLPRPSCSRTLKIIGLNANVKEKEKGKGKLQDSREPAKDLRSCPPSRPGDLKIIDRNANVKEKGQGKLQDSQHGNQAKFPRKELKTKKAALAILEKDFPEEINTHKVDNGSRKSKDLLTDSFLDGLRGRTYGKNAGLDMLFDAACLVEPQHFNDTSEEKVKEIDDRGESTGKDSGFDHKPSLFWEANQSGTSNHKSCLEMETADNPFSSIASQEEVEEIDDKGESAGKDNKFDHKPSSSDEANQSGTSNHKSYPQMETADNPFSSIASQEEVKEIDDKGESAGKDNEFDHKPSSSDEANQSGTKEMLDFDLNLLPGEE